jgi:catechol 2,3-dioxygenase-like lactoylglutathione lyase family enzyme
MLATSQTIGILPTTDKTKAKEFYQNVLGLTFVKDDGFALVFRAHYATIRIVQMPELKAAAYTVLGWEVADIGDEVRELAASGVAFERYPWFEQDALGIWTAPNGDKVAWFKDPDGNVLSLSQHIV